MRVVQMTVLLKGTQPEEQKGALYCLVLSVSVILLAVVLVANVTFTECVIMCDISLLLIHYIWLSIWHTVEYN